MAIGLPEVIYTSAGDAYLHLPGVIVTENAADEVRYLLSDGLGSVRQATDEIGIVLSYREYDPYGNPLAHSPFAHSPFAYSGEWWEDAVDLLHLRARWYAPEIGTFLSRDAVESEPPYQYVRGNPVNLVDPSGLFPEHCKTKSTKEKYVFCVLWHYPLAQPIPIPVIVRSSPLPLIFPMGIRTDNVQGTSGCFSGPVPYLGAGYAEGGGVNSLPIRASEEVVYDFATMERQRFRSGGAGLSDALIFNAATSVSVSAIIGFRSIENIVDDYSGITISGSVGASAGPSLPPNPFDWGIGIGFGPSITPFSGLRPYPYGVSGINMQLSLTGGLDLIPVGDIGINLVYGWPIDGTNKSYIIDDDTPVDIIGLINDIKDGQDSPWTDTTGEYIIFPEFPDLIPTRWNFSRRARFELGIPLARTWSQIYDDIHLESK